MPIHLSHALRRDYALHENRDQRFAIESIVHQIGGIPDQIGGVPNTAVPIKTVITNLSTIPGAEVVEDLGSSGDNTDDNIVTIRLKQGAYNSAYRLTLVSRIMSITHELHISILRNM